MTWPPQSFALLAPPELQHACAGKDSIPLSQQSWYGPRNGFIISIKTCTPFPPDPGDWPRLHTHLSDDLVFQTRPNQSAIPIGSSLLAVRHQAVQNKTELQRVHISTDKRVWL